MRWLAVAGVAALAAGAWWYLRPARPEVLLHHRVDRLVPEGVRIRVEVVNATTERGLARRATFYLRDLGFDVVRFSSGQPGLDSTLVLDRSGHPAWAGLVGNAFGEARVESRPDSSRHVDVTILIGKSGRPASLPLYP